MTNDVCVGIRGNNIRFGRWETHESKQRRLYIYQRAAPSLSLCSATLCSTEASLAPDGCTADYTNSCTYVHRVFCVVQLGPMPFCQTKTMQILVACYRDRITILFNEALQLLLDSCLFIYLSENVLMPCLRKVP